VAYPQKTRNKPAKRRALDARFPAARPPFKRDLYCAGENREKRAASRVSLSQSRVCHPRPPNRALVDMNVKNEEQIISVATTQIQFPPSTRGPLHFVGTKYTS